jgi:hypothetical protein
MKLTSVPQKSYDMGMPPFHPLFPEMLLFLQLYFETESSELLLFRIILNNAKIKDARK